MIEYDTIALLSPALSPETHTPAGSFEYPPAIILPPRVELKTGAPLPPMKPGEFVLEERYQITERLHSGDTYCEVYQATDTLFREAVALKIFHERDELTEERVDRELTTHVGLDGQSGIIGLHDMGILNKADGKHRYLATKFAEKGSLSRQAKAHPGDIELAVNSALGFLPGLQIMHANGLIHCDIKPGNIIGQPEQWNLTDFGVVELEHAAKKSRLTHGLGALAVYEETAAKRVIRGTTLFTAPERLERGETLPQSDVYSFGVTLHNVLTNDFPIAERESFTELKYAIINESPASVDAVNRSIPLSLSRLILQCLKKEPKDRPAIPEIIAELQEYKSVMFSTA